MKITTQLRAIVAGILLFGVSNVVSVYINSAGNDGKVVNYAGIVRGGSQRLVKLELAGKNSDQLIVKLDKLVNGLINGDQALKLPPATDQEFLSQMKKVESSWKNLKGTIARVRQEPTYRNELLTQSEQYFELTDKAVFSAEEFSKVKAQRLQAIQLVLFGISLIITVIIWLIARNITSTLQTSIRTIATSSTQIAAAVQEQERTVSQQASSVNQTTVTMDELSASSQQSAEQAEASAAAARMALSLAGGGTKSVEETMEGMSTLKAKVEAIAQQIMRLSEQTNQIGSVSDLVGDLANQTNMLALNAAVEAARAGEYGKGFGVVAGEIRKLADQSKKSAEKINALVTDIQSAISTTVMVTDDGTKNVDAGIKLAQGTAETFTGVADSINNVFLNSQQISLSSKQQANAVQQVVDAMNAINLGAKESASGIVQVKASTQHLNDAAHKLKAVV